MLKTDFIHLVYMPETSCISSINYTPLQLSCRRIRHVIISLPVNQGFAYILMMVAHDRGYIKEKGFKVCCLAEYG